MSKIKKFVINVNTNDKENNLISKIKKVFRLENNEIEKKFQYLIIKRLIELDNFSRFLKKKEPLKIYNKISKNNILYTCSSKIIAKKEVTGFKTFFDNKYILEIYYEILEKKKKVFSKSLPKVQQFSTISNNNNDI